MRKLILAAAVLTTGMLAAAAPAQAAPKGENREWAVDYFIGSWVGEGDTVGYADHFKIAIKINDDGSATLAYDASAQAQPYTCAGLLLPMEETHRTRTYREKITSGPCIDGAEVTLSAKAKFGHLEWSWAGDDNGKPVTAKGWVKQLPPN